MEDRHIFYLKTRPLSTSFLAPSWLLVYLESSAVKRMILFLKVSRSVWGNSNSRVIDAGCRFSVSLLTGVYMFIRYHFQLHPVPQQIFNQTDNYIQFPHIAKCSKYIWIPLLSTAAKSLLALILWAQNSSSIILITLLAIINYPNISRLIRMLR